MSASRSRPGTRLLDRHGERALVEGVLGQARAGSSAVLVVRGEPGIGKTALLDYAAGRALGFRVIWTRGVESEMELAFAGLHQLCAPMLGRLGQLPKPQRDALAVALGMQSPTSMGSTTSRRLACDAPVGRALDRELAGHKDRAPGGWPPVQLGRHRRPLAREAETPAVRKRRASLAW